MEDLLKYFMAQSNRRFDVIETKIDELKETKIEMVASARLVSLIVSSFCGLITMLLTLWVAVKTKG